MFTGKDERRKTPGVVISEQQVEEIVERAAERAAAIALATFYGDFYEQVGKVTVKSLLYICGAAFTALAVWLGLTEKLG